MLSNQKNGKKCSKMPKNGQKMPKNGPKCPKITKIGLFLAKNQIFTDLSGFYFFFTRMPLNRPIFGRSPTSGFA